MGSTPTAYDRFMVHVKIGANRKLRRLTPAQRWVYVAGVLSIAAEAPVRGCLLVYGQEPATVDDIADQACVGKGLASSTVDRCREIGLIEYDPDLACELVHDWEDYNPAPRSNDRTMARERQRRRRLRLKQEKEVA